MASITENEATISSGLLAAAASSVKFNDLFPDDVDMNIFNVTTNNTSSNPAFIKKWRGAHLPTIPLSKVEEDKSTPWKIRQDFLKNWYELMTLGSQSLLAVQQNVHQYWNLVNPYLSDQSDSIPTTAWLRNFENDDNYLYQCQNEKITLPSLPKNVQDGVCSENPASNLFPPNEEFEFSTAASDIQDPFQIFTYRQRVISLPLKLEPYEAPNSNSDGLLASPSNESGQSSMNNEKPAHVELNSQIFNQLLQFNATKFFRPNNSTTDNKSLSFSDILAPHTKIGTQQADHRKLSFSDILAPHTKIGTQQADHRKLSFSDILGPQRQADHRKPVRTYRCKQCDYEGKSKDDYWFHYRIHIKAHKLLSCPKCLFVTEHKHHLEYHLRNHFGSKPFECTKCSYTCINKAMLKSHMKSHTNHCDYRCADCHYATKYCHSLKMHLRKHAHKALNRDEKTGL